jgi:hypothetical protein
MARASQIDASRLLQDTEERPIGISLPLPLSKRLDLLVERTERAGARAYRKDILAALILAAPETPEELLDLFSRYRTATAGDASLADQPRSAVLRDHRHKPGRRVRSAR